MSRIGKLPISIPAGVTVAQGQDSVVTVKGPKGELSQKVDPSIKVSIADGHVTFEIDENSPVNVKQKQAFHGLYRALVNNMVVGVSEGYKKEMELVGVGYRVSNQGNIIEFSLGYTHPIFIQLPKEVKVETKMERNQNPQMTPEIIRRALEMTHIGRDYIIDEVLLKAIPAPRAEVSKYAPKMTTMKIDPDKIREVIGKGGSVIQKIVADTGAKIDINDDGTICIAAINSDQADAAKACIDAIVFEPTVGAVYTGKVTGIKEFGCFVEYAPGKEGMVHISKIAPRRIEKVEDVLKLGDVVKVKYMGLDKKGRMDFSIKDALDA